MAERFWEKVEVAGPNECWLWLASIAGAGYGQFQRSQGSRRAHVVAYELTNGPVPPGHEVHHTCEVRLCCNPAHLRAKLIRKHRADHTKAYHARRNGFRALKGAK